MANIVPGSGIVGLRTKRDEVAVQHVTLGMLHTVTHKSQQTRKMEYLQLQEFGAVEYNGTING